MDNKNKFLLGLAFLFFIAMVIIVSLSFKNIPKGKESFAQNPSPGKKFLTSDINGNLSLYTTNTDSIIVTDSTGEMKNLPFPKGLIMIWHNNRTTNPTNEDLAPGWSLCDGGTYNNYKTPDLRGRFVLGAGSGTDLTARTVGVVGGAETHTLTKDQMPSHNHGGATGNSLPNDHRMNNSGNCGSGPSFGCGSDGINSGTNLNHSHVINSDGGNQPHNNMPPYYVLCYICYTGDRL